MSVELTVDGDPATLSMDDADLATALRRAGYTGVKCGCDGGVCGASTVLIDGEAKMACGMPASEAEGSEIETVAALGSQDDLHPIQQAFVDHHAVQCGFCIPGMIVSAKHLLDDEPDPTESEVRAAIDHVYCRCTGYQKPVDAILDAAERMRDGPAVAADGGGNPDGGDQATHENGGDTDD